MRKAAAKQRNDDLRPEYDLARLKGGVRGKYYKQATAGTNLVLLDPDVSRTFPDSASVNRALRFLQEIANKDANARRSGGAVRKVALVVELPAGEAKGARRSGGAVRGANR